MKLADIIEEWISGDWGSEQSSTEVSEKVYCLRSADISPIYNAAFDTAAVRYISTHSLSRNQLKEGDIVIEKSGGTNSCSTGRVILITKDILAKNTPLVCSNFCAAFRVKENWDSAFVYYYFRLIHRSGVFLNFEGKTSGIHNLLIDTAFATIDFPDVDLSTQKRIASVLSNIDRKIALNRAMNEELEQTARDLYDYWFLQFDFPDANGKPYRSSGGKMIYNDTLKREIPQGWEVKTIGDVAVITNGATPNTREDKNYGGDIVWITPDDLSKQKRKFTYFGSRCITEQGYKSCSTHLMSAGSILLSSRAPIGLLSIAMVDLCTNQGFKSLVPVDMRYTKYLYYNVQTHVEQIKKLGTGSTFSEVSKKELEPFPILMAPDMLIEAFNEKIDDIFNQQFILEQEIDLLRSLRDELLPLLMNGQVEVKD